MDAVVAYIFVFGSGLLGGFLFQFFVQDTSFPSKKETLKGKSTFFLGSSYIDVLKKNHYERGLDLSLFGIYTDLKSKTLCIMMLILTAGGWIVVMELYPGFALYRGFYEFSQYSFIGNYMGTNGMTWSDLSDGSNGMKEVLIIIAVEWLVVLFVAYYIDQISSGSGKTPLFFVEKFRKKKLSSFRKPSLRRQGSKVFVQMDKPDVIEEVIFFSLYELKLFFCLLWCNLLRK